MAHVASVLLVATAAAVASVTIWLHWHAWPAPQGGEHGFSRPQSTVWPPQRRSPCYRAHKTGQDAGALAWVALLAGLAASVAGNITSVYPELVDVGTLKVAVGATPPLSLALSVELALRQVRGTDR